MISVGNDGPNNYSSRILHDLAKETFLSLSDKKKNQIIVFNSFKVLHVNIHT